MPQITPLNIGAANAYKGDALRDAGQKLNDTFQAFYEMPLVAQAAATTLYVSTSGSDSNDGLTVGTPFLTIQKAVDAFNGHFNLAQTGVTIQLADGTYTLTEPVYIGRMYSTGTLTITGNSVTPSNVVVTSSTSTLFRIFGGNWCVLSNFELSCTLSGGACIHVYEAGRVQTSGLVYGTSTGADHIYITDLGNMLSSAAYSITGGAARHYYVSNCGTVRSSSAVTLTGTPAFSTGFLVARNKALVNLVASSFTGSATGQRYNVQGIAVVPTGGLTLPGNVGGTAINGGQYT